MQTSRQNERGPGSDSQSVRPGESRADQVQDTGSAQSDGTEESARLRGAVAEAIRLMDTEPLMVRAMWMPIRDVLTDAMEER